MSPRLRIPFSLVIVTVALALVIVDASSFGAMSGRRLLVYVVAAGLIVIAYESMPHRRHSRRRARRRRRGQCETCGYDLRGRDTSPGRHRCPECGSAIGNSA